MDIEESPPESRHCCRPISAKTVYKAIMLILQLIQVACIVTVSIMIISSIGAIYDSVLNTMTKSVESINVIETTIIADTSSIIRSIDIFLSLINTTKTQFLLDMKVLSDSGATVASDMNLVVQFGSMLAPCVQRMCTSRNQI